MRGRRFPISNPVIQIFLLVFAVLALLSIAWVLGGALSRTGGAEPDVLLTITQAPTAGSEATALPVVPTSVPAANSTATPKPTSTPRPTPVPEHTEVIVVKSGDYGLYDVCRRHCPGLDFDSGLEAYARRVADRNNLPWGASGPSVVPGQELDMPSCP